MPKYNLIYFNVKGRGETIRFMFHVAGVKYTDKRIEGKDWPDLKPTMPFEKLPVLEIDGRKLAESCAIARFLAKEHGLAGKNSLESATIDSVAEVITDIREKIIAVAILEKDEKKKEERMKDFKENVIPPFLADMEKFVSNNKNKGEKGFIVSDKMSWADLHLMYVCDILASNFEPKGKEDMFEKAPKVKALLKRINEDEKVKDWKTQRPQTPF